MDLSYDKECDLLDDKRKKVIRDVNKIRDNSKCLFSDVKFKCNYEKKRGLTKNHLIQRGKYLDSIASNGKVMIYNIEDENYYRHGRKMSRVNIKKAHTYKVFCAMHDKMLFDAIENGKEFDIDNKEQCFQFALRAFCFEYSQSYIKGKFSSGNRIVDRKHNYSLKYANVILERFKKCYIEEKWSDIETYSIILDKKVKFISCCCIVPFIDLKKRYRGYVKDYVFINVFPKGEKTYMLISYFKDSKSNKRLCKQIDGYVKEKKYRFVEDYFNKILTSEDLNLTLGPELWDGWTEEEKEDFYRYAHKLKVTKFKNLFVLIHMLRFNKCKFNLFKDFNRDNKTRL